MLSGHQVPGLGHWVNVMLLNKRIQEATQVFLGGWGVMNVLSLLKDVLSDYLH